MPVPNLDLANSLTEFLAGENFDEALEHLPAFQAAVDSRLADAAGDGEREQILTEALALNGRWLALAQSLRAGMASQLRSLEAEAHYAEAQTPAPLIETTL